MKATREINPIHETKDGRAPISEVTRRYKQVIAAFLNDRTRHLSGKTWLFLLIVFCGSIGTYCLKLILDAFN